MTKHACPCCGRRTLTGKGHCEICRANYERLGAVEERFVVDVRPPKAGE